MSGGNYWDWVRHVPPGSGVSEELLTPTKVASVNLVIKILESELVGNDIVDLLGQLLSEIARYNIWFASEVDGKTSPETHATLYTVYRDVTPKVYEAWKRYQIACATESPVDDGDDMGPEYLNLLAVLRDVVEELSAVRSAKP
jgi:hypothetical protein